MATCGRHGSNHKNNNSQVKSAAAVSATQMHLPNTIADNILNDTAYSIFAESLKATDLFEVLTKPGPFTVFAPANTAFKKLPAGTLEGLMKERTNDLTNILSHHIVAGALQKKDLEENRRPKTLAGEALIVSKRNSELIVNGVRIKSTGRQASNGMIYTIDGLLFPINQNPGAY